MLFGKFSYLFDIIYLAGIILVLHLFSVLSMLSRGLVRVSRSMHISECLLVDECC